MKVDKFPDHKNLSKYLMMTDKCWARDGKPHSIQVTLVKDHPFLIMLSQLDGVPKSVKAIYQANLRLGQFMASSCWETFKSLDKADKAWDNYLQRTELEEV